MYFSAFDGNNWRIYRSSSINGLNWQECEVVIDMSSEGYLPDVKAPSVIRNKKMSFECIIRDFQNQKAAYLLRSQMMVSIGCIPVSVKTFAAGVALFTTQM